MQQPRIRETERRHFHRANLRTMARVTTENPTQHIEGKCCDISRAGILLDLPNGIEQGVTVNISLLDPLSLNPLMSAKAQVVRCEKNAHGGYTVGLTMLTVQ